MGKGIKVKKYHIEKNTVQETLIIPLYGRQFCKNAYCKNTVLKRKKKNA